MNPTEVEIDSIVQKAVVVAAGTTEADASAETTALPPRHTVTRSRPAQVVLPHMLDTLRSLLMIIVLALFVLTFLLQPFRIPSESMERTLLVGDFLLVNKSVFGPAGHWGWLLPYRKVQRGDIVVFHFPLDASEHVVKRVVGVPGDKLRLHNGLLFRDGALQHEPYAVYESAYPDSYRDQFPASSQYTDPGVDMHWWLQMRKAIANGQLVVPPESYFALGDNRNHSRDSRYWGFVPPQNIVGMPFVIYFSVREPSATDTAALPDDKLTQSALGRLLDFARWNRVLHLVR